ncbi:Zinc resistance conferring protein, partial [Elasticomyces elasticus]
MRSFIIAGKRDGGSGDPEEKVHELQEQSTQNDVVDNWRAPASEHLSAEGETNETSSAEIFCKPPSVTVSYYNSSTATPHNEKNDTLKRSSILPRRPEPAHTSREKILQIVLPQRNVPAYTQSTASLQQCCVQPLKKERRIGSGKMALTKSQRIIILLAIDTVFFFVELIIGYAVHSLALVADAFHMLNDVLSLCVGLWAVKVAQSGSSKNYTYGWQRAETLGALVNGVFLVALCVTIFLEAIQRFVEKPNVTNPKLVLIVGCIGLASNILGLFLFHDHSHGPGGHSHGDEEEGHAHSHTHSHGHDHGTEGHNHANHHAHDEEHHKASERSPLMAKSHSHDHSPKSYTKSDSDGTTINGGANGTPPRQKSVPGQRRRRQSGFGSVDNIHIHPASFRNDIIQASRYQEEDIEEEAIEPEYSHEHDHDHDNSHQHINGTAKKIANAHKNHLHNQPKDAKSGGGGHGHSHDDLNMKGVFLHVMGDALGNIGVIVTALIIWLTTFPGRFYFDPAVSLVITAIILTSAIPLCKAASRILLQAVPMGMSIDEIRADIEDLDQVVEAHHLHVWQLSDTKLVASLHVKVDCDVKGAGYMKLAREIRQCLHGYGIHSSTIQPEFLQQVPTDGHDHAASTTGAASPAKPSVSGSKAGSLMSADGRAAGPG